MAVFAERGAGSHAEWSALVIEDEMIIAGAIEDLLVALGAVEVLVSHSAAAAAEAVRTGRFTVAVVDWHLGGSTAAPLVASLNEAGTGVVLVTGADLEVVRESAEPGTIILEKPYRDQELADAVRRALARRGILATNGP